VKKIRKVGVGRSSLRNVQYKTVEVLTAVICVTVRI